MMSWLNSASFPRANHSWQVHMGHFYIKCTGGQSSKSLFWGHSDLNDIAGRISQSHEWNLKIKNIHKHINMLQGSNSRTTWTWFAIGLHTYTLSWTATLALFCTIRRSQPQFFRFCSSAPSPPFSWSDWRPCLEKRNWAANAKESQANILGGSSLKTLDKSPSLRRTLQTVAPKDHNHPFTLRKDPISQVTTAQE